MQPCDQACKLLSTGLPSSAEFEPAKMLSWFSSEALTLPITVPLASMPSTPYGDMVPSSLSLAPGMPLVDTCRSTGGTSTAWLAANEASFRNESSVALALVSM